MRVAIVAGIYTEVLSCLLRRAEMINETCAEIIWRENNGRYTVKDGSVRTQASADGHLASSKISKSAQHQGIVKLPGSKTRAAASTSPIHNQSIR